jgi:hypothetical protein
MARLPPFFPKSHGKPRVEDRRVLSGIIFIARNGLRWCDAPKEYGPPKTLYNRWKRWGDKTDRVPAMLARPQGATLEAICEATGWQPHSARAVLSGMRKSGT